jgi:hypothetical protein
MQMNTVPIFTSEWVQRGGRIVVCMTNGKGISCSVDLKQEDTMLKQISAALLAASLLTAPALAAEGKSATTTPVTANSAMVKAPDAASTAVKSSNKSVSAKPGDAMNAKAQATTTPPVAAKPAAKKVRHSMRDHRHHTTVSSNHLKSQNVASIKHISSPKSASKVQPTKS